MNHVYTKPLKLHYHYFSYEFSPVEAHRKSSGNEVLKVWYIHDSFVYLGSIIVTFVTVNFIIGCIKINQEND